MPIVKRKSPSVAKIVLTPATRSSVKKFCILAEGIDSEFAALLARAARFSKERKPRLFPLPSVGAIV